ncbi:MAG: hypothetical protein EA001_00195 [Oscillatoriales cyanobacterium]|nr:MAG: hypothetical protein EA001_00195 [Oscillatoriales cyanobacterium]
MLVKNSSEWQFQDEATFENLLWGNLREWLELTPLARQLGICGEYCDIVACDSAGSPVILELKNQEDRYIVQQLTRYYHNFLEEHPNLKDIHHLDSPKLIGIAPTLHRHNFIDQLYHQLNIELWTFKLQEQNGQFWLEFTIWNSSEESTVLKKIDITSSLKIPTTPPVDPLSHLDKNWRIILSKRSEIDQKRLLAIRDRILSFSSNLGEVATLSKSTYGQKRGQKSLCISEERLCLSIEGLSTSKLPSISIYIPFFSKSSYLRVFKAKLVLISWDEIQYIQFPKDCDLMVLRECRQRDFNDFKHYLNYHEAKNNYRLSTQAYIDFHNELSSKFERFQNLCGTSNLDGVLKRSPAYQNDECIDAQKPYTIQSLHSLDDMIDFALLSWQHRQEQLKAKRQTKVE